MSSKKQQRCYSRQRKHNKITEKNLNVEENSEKINELVN
jgi:hypothetical protein